MNSNIETYFQFLDLQKFAVDELDYSLLEHHKPNLQKLAELSNSTISVFDSYLKKHVFYSSNCGKALGYTSQDFENGGDRFLDSKVHPDDLTGLWKNAFIFIKLFYNLPYDEKMDYKIISEYRILNAIGKYVRVIEQQQVLELDTNGNPWLALSIFDISPNQQNMDEGVKSELLNFKTGKIFPYTRAEKAMANALSKREIEILKLVKDGLLSKEISDKLTISLHTVNTHRQRVLEKLDVNNSLEAVKLASKLGLI
ncbi:MAG: LuxR C-terminal-related transcriptional regulator [Tannerella sp.]|jgi:DNA-binding CsgD family transcriptional regulator|nr:LuxR C-terminal-related transcriptional regulator [Tannerella sp.]